MPIQTTPQEYRVTDPHALVVVADGGGVPVFEVDTLTRAVKIAGRILIDGVTISTGVVSKTEAYTATPSDFVILCNASGGAFPINLPAASGAARRIYHIKKTDSSGNAVTVDANGSETIDGALTQVINVQYDSMEIICDGSNWHII